MINPGSWNLLRKFPVPTDHKILYQNTIFVAKTNARKHASSTCHDFHTSFPQNPAHGGCPCPHQRGKQQPAGDETA